MSNLVARHAFRDLRRLMDKAGRPYDAPSLSRILRQANHSSPDVKTVQLIVYRHKPIKSAMAESIISAFQKIMREGGIIGANDNLLFGNYVFEYSSYLPQLSDAIGRMTTTQNDPENTPLQALSAHVGCNETIVRAMMRGSERLVPHDFAERVGQAAMMVCGLSRPLEVVRCSANERNLKPIGGDTGRPPDKCDVSTTLRGHIVDWYTDDATAR